MTAAASTNIQKWLIEMTKVYIQILLLLTTMKSIKRQASAMSRMNKQKCSSPIDVPAC